MDALYLEALWLAGLAGAAIPLGGLLALHERLSPNWLEQEFRHGVVAFGGGALLAAVALVLVPEGSAGLASGWSGLWLLAGGVVFLLADRSLEQRAGGGAQLLALLLDFLPEAMALGATLAMGEGTALLLALLIALQNLPEGFNACRELLARTHLSAGRILLLFFVLVPLGPLAAWLGLFYLADRHDWLGAIMLFAAGGILYLIFNDIAPQATLRRRWGPPLGAVLGFALGMLGHQWLVAQ